MVLFSQPSRAQHIGDYGVTNTTGAYVDLGTNGSIITTTTGSLDDGLSAPLDIGFPFLFGGNLFTKFKFNPNGWITFNLTTANITGYSALNSAETQVIASFNRDLLGLVDSLPEFRYFIDGTAPFRICKIQYRNIGFYNSGIQAGRGNIQIWLYETSNRVELRYGRFDQNFTSNTVQVGLKSFSTSSTDIRSLSGTGPTTWSNPTAGNSASATMAVSSTIVPDSGRIYAFGSPVHIAHTPLTNSPVLSGRVVSATIMAAAGVATGANAPRLYFRPATSGLFSSLPMNNASGNIWEATIPPQAGGTVVQYYIAAQNLDSIPSVLTSPPGGSGTNPPGSTPPPIRHQYVVSIPLSGTYTIDRDTLAGSRNYVSFTDAFLALDASGVGGPTRIIVTGEADTVIYPEANLTLGGVASALFTSLNAADTLLLTAATGKTVILSGAGAGGADYAIRLRGVQHVTVDRIHILDTATTDVRRIEYGYLITNAGPDRGASNNTIRNFTVTLQQSNLNGTTGLAVANGTQLIGSTLGTTGTYQSRNNGNRVQNFIIRNVRRGIALDGLPAPAHDSNNEISGPPFTAATGGVWAGGSRITQWGSSLAGTDWGIGIDGQDGARILNMQIDSGSTTAAGTAMSGIHFGTAASTSDGSQNVEISRCVIRAIGNDHAAPTAGVAGVRASGTAVHTARIQNSVIYDLRNEGAGAGNLLTAVQFNGPGAGSRLELYFNSVHITSTMASAGTARGILTSSGAISVAARNNALQITGGGATGGATAVELGGTPTLVDFAANVYHVGVTSASRRVGVYGSDGRRDLLDWQSTMPAPSDGLDPRSAQGLPGFMGATDLRIDTTGNRVHNSGLPVSGITTDILGTPRGTTPDIGAFEGSFAAGFVDAAAASVAIAPFDGSIGAEIPVVVNDNVTTTGPAIVTLWHRPAGPGEFRPMRPDQTPAGTNNGTYRWSTSLRALPVGTYEYYVVARDSAGNFFASPTMTPGSASPGFLTYGTDSVGWAGVNPFPGAGVRTFINTGSTLSGGTYTVGTGEAFPTLTAAAAAINARPLAGDVVFELTDNYSGSGEVLPIIINQPAYVGIGPYRITIRPAGGVTIPRVTEGDPGSGSAVLTLDGARYITLDGRPGGSGSSRMWRISNTRGTGAIGEAIRLVNDALADTLRFLIAESNTQEANLGVISLAGTYYGGRGNSENLIDNCEVRSYAAGSSTPPNPARGISSFGDGRLALNRNNVFSNNLISDFHSTSSSPGGIVLAHDAGGRITGNHFYQTVPRSGITQPAYGIQIGPSTGAGHIISHNTIGGSAPNAGGSPYTLASTNGFFAIDVDLSGASTPSTISGNRIANINLTTASLTPTVQFAGIQIRGGTQATITVSGNAIGDTSVDATTNPSILVTTTTAVTTLVHGVLAPAGRNVIAGNAIGGFRLAVSGSGQATAFSGIQQQTSSLAVVIDSNVIGSATSPSNIHQNTNTTAHGIVVSSGGGTISNNTIAGFLFDRPSGGGNQSFIGISGTSGVLHITRNTIADVTTNSVSTSVTSSAAVTGIFLGSVLQGHTIAGNRVVRLSNIPATASASTTVQGLYISAAGSRGRVEGNLMHTLLNSSTSTSAFIRGMYNFNGEEWLYANNMISLGHGVEGDLHVRGIDDFSNPPAQGGAKYYFNSVWIDGSVPGAGINTYAFMKRSTTAGRFQLRNNILVNTRTGSPGVSRGFALAVTSASGWPPGTSDYNIFRTSTADVAQWLGTVSFFNRTLAGWRAFQPEGSQGDSMTIAGDPRFLSASDLHIAPGSALPSNNGLALAGIVDTDFDGDTRSATTPDRGADEYVAVPPSAFSLLLPANGTLGAPISGLLVWQRAQHADAYDVYLDTLSPPTNLVSANQSDSSYVYSVGPLDTLYWTVVARNGIGTTPPLAAPFSFLTVLPDTDYTVVSVLQPDAIPTPFNLAPAGGAAGERRAIPTGTLQYGGPIRRSSGVNNSTVVRTEPGRTSPDNGGGVRPVTLLGIVQNFSAGSPAYQFMWTFDGSPQAPIPRPGIPSLQRDTVSLDITPGRRGTLTAIATATAPGDTNTINNTVVFHRVLSYPDTMVRIRYDNGQHVPDIFHGFGNGTTPLTAGVRFRAGEQMRLANIDAFYRTESSTDSVLVEIRAAGADSAAPGVVLFRQRFGGATYLSASGDYITLPLTDDAPSFVAGTDFWVTITFDAAVTFPLGAHNSPLATPGHSFFSGDSGFTWMPLVVSGSERAWLLRTVGVPSSVVPPVVSDVRRSQKVPPAGTSTIVTARLADTSGIVQALLLPSINGTPSMPVAMSRISGTVQDGIYRGIIPAAAYTNGDRVQYQVEGRSSSGLSTLTTISAANSFFAGTSPLLPSGVKAVEPNGLIRYDQWYARVAGTVSSPNFDASAGSLSYFLQDSSGGINLFKSGTTTPVLRTGDSVVVVGKLQQVRGLILIEPDTATAEIARVDSGRALSSIVLTVPQYRLNPELYESRLIRVDSLRRRDATPPWPGTGQDALLIMYRNILADTLGMFLDRDTDIPGSAEPPYPIRVTGIAGQFSSGPTVHNDGYRLIPRFRTDIDTSTVGVSGGLGGIPATYQVAQNFPNPFNPRTTIRYGLPQQSQVRITVFNTLGQEVATLVNEVKEAGHHEVHWESGGSASGVYFYRLHAQAAVGEASFTRVMKMIVLR